MVTPREPGQPGGWAGRLLSPVGSPFGLAAARAGVCVAAWVSVELSASALLGAAGLSADQRRSVPVLGLLGLLPAGPFEAAAGVGLWAARGALLLGAVGMAARPAMALAAAMLTWMGIVLASAGAPGQGLVPAAGVLAALACWRCDDVLSLAGLRRAVVRADRGVTDSPADAPRYGAPIRLLWLVGGLGLMALGAAALASGAGAGGSAAWLPVAMALLSMAWLPLALVDRARPALAAIGVALPLVAWAAAGGPLHPLAPLSLLLVDWALLARRVGRGLFGQPLVVLYDGHCTLCRRTAAVLATLDVLGQLRFVNMLDAGARRQAGVDRFDEAALATDIHVVAGERVWRGFEGYRAICWRLPWYWPVLWALYVPPVPALGRRAYRRVADSRLCSRLGAPDPAAQQRQRAEMNDDRPVWATASGRAGLALAVVAAAVTAGLVLAGVE